MCFLKIKKFIIRLNQVIKGAKSQFEKNVFIYNYFLELNLHVKWFVYSR